jgi:hypothetical protein
MSSPATTRAARLGATFVLIGLAVGSCKREDDSARYPQGGPPATGWTPPPTEPTAAPYPPQAPPEAQPPAEPTTQPTPEPSPPPAQAPAGPPPAPGFPCASDADLQCPFARCVGGRCGGCRSDADCKTGAACAQSLLGMACVPGSGTSAPPPAPTPATPAPTTPAPTTPPTTDPFAAARARCLQRVNEYRATAGSSPLVARTDRQSCADSQAQSDATNKTPHGAFGKCAETAQNECPGWKGTVDSVLDACLKAMFAEGPGTGPAHGHYNNMVEPAYRSVACGFHVAADGAVWIIQDYYR